MNRAPWYATASAAHLAVQCGGVRHQITWREGALELDDHPDVDSELALIAFGGEEPPCLALRALWLDAVGDGGFLAEWVDPRHLSPARRSWLTMALERMRNEGFHEFLRDLPLPRAQRMGRFVHAFPGPWLDRAACTVIEAIVDPKGAGVVCDRAPDLIEPAITARLRQAFVSSVGGRRLSIGAAALVPLTVGVAPLATPTVAGGLLGADRGVRLAVHPSWLHTVWGAGAAVIDHQLVLRLATNTDANAEGKRGITGDALVVCWDEPSAPQLMEIAVRHDGERWIGAHSPEQPLLPAVGIVSPQGGCAGGEGN
ncbi:MAG: hypothetical protein AAF467_03125 [Actinomycetota bacterium]